MTRLISRGVSPLWIANDCVSDPEEVSQEDRCVQLVDVGLSRNLKSQSAISEDGFYKQLSSRRWRNVADSSKLSGEQNRAHRRSEHVMPGGNLLGAVRTGNYRSQTMAFRRRKQRLFVVLLRKCVNLSWQAYSFEQTRFFPCIALAFIPSRSCLYHLASLFHLFLRVRLANYRAYKEKMIDSHRLTSLYMYAKGLVPFCCHLSHHFLRVVISYFVITYSICYRSVICMRLYVDEEIMPRRNFVESYFGPSKSARARARGNLYDHYFIYAIYASTSKKRNVLLLYYYTYNLLTIYIYIYIVTFVRFATFTLSRPLRTWKQTRSVGKRIIRRMPCHDATDLASVFKYRPEAIGFLGQK